MTPTSRKPLVLDPDIYHALHFSSLVYGGIGAGEFADGYDRPICAVGHIHRLTELKGTLGHRRRVIRVGDNDAAVRLVNLRRRKRPDARIPFEDWCAAMHVVPGQYRKSRTSRSRKSR